MNAAESKRSVASTFALAGGLASWALDGLYLAAIAQQGVTPPGGRFVFVALWIAAAGMLAVIGAFTRRPVWRGPPLSLAAAMLFALAVPAVFSIGIPLMLCAALVAVGAVRAGELAQRPAWAGLLAPLVLLLIAGVGVAVGFAVTDF
jgi:hypothetical protein